MEQGYDQGCAQRPARSDVEEADTPPVFGAAISSVFTILSFKIEAVHSRVGSDGEVHHLIHVIPFACHPKGNMFTCSPSKCLRSAALPYSLCSKIAADISLFYTSSEVHAPSNVSQDRSEVSGERKSTAWLNILSKSPPADIFDDGRMLSARVDCLAFDY